MTVTGVQRFEPEDAHHGLKALIFDVFGTVVDYRAPLIETLSEFGSARGLTASWEDIADEWRAGERQLMDRVNAGEQPWTKLDELRRSVIRQLFSDHGLPTPSDDDATTLAFGWHRARAWPDATEAIKRLRSRYIVLTLSNSPIVTLIDIAKRAGIAWDCVLSSEVVQAYKPDPRTYRRAVELVADRPDEVMMVAAHDYDLRAADALGLRTAFVHRPLEHGAARPSDIPPQPTVDLLATDLLDLARHLGVGAEERVPAELG